MTDGPVIDLNPPKIRAALLRPSTKSLRDIRGERPPWPAEALRI